MPAFSVTVTGLTVKMLMVIGIASAVNGLTQSALEVMVQLITCPLVKTPEYDDPLATVTPSTFQV